MHEKESIPPLPAKLALKNPRAVVSLYFVILCVALSWLWASSSTTSHHHPHHSVVVKHEQQQKSSWQMFGIKTFFPASSSQQQEESNSRNADSLALKNRDAVGHADNSITTTSSTDPAPTTTTEETFVGIRITEEEKTLTEHLLLTIGLLMLSATFAGLTLGIMGLDTVTLEVIAEAAPEPDRSYAKELLPVRHLGHQCLCTLILGNMWANVMIANVSSDILPGEGGPAEGGGIKAVLAFLLSTSLILIFAEIVPMSICTGPNALKIAAMMVPVLKIFIFLLYPVAKPLGWLLDKILHHDPGQIYDREELKKLFMMHAQKHQAVSGLKTTELDLLLGAFDFGDRVVKDVMTPFETVVVLRSDAVLDAKLLRLLWACGHSRFPIIDASQLPPQSPNTSRSSTSFNNNNSNKTTSTTNSLKNSLKVPADLLDRVQIIGLLYVKDLLLVMDQNLTVEEVLDMFPHGEVYSVWQSAQLRHLLSSFQQGVTHLVFVRSNAHEEDEVNTKNIKDENAMSPRDNSSDSTSSPKKNASSSDNVIDDEVEQRAGTLSVLTPHDKIIGIVTLEALIETLIRAPIWDEHDDGEEGDLQFDTTTSSSTPSPAAASASGSADNAVLSVISTSNPFNQQHQAMRLRKQMKSVHFFDFAVSREEASKIPEGTAVAAPALTTPQCLAIGRFLRQSVESFTPFVEDSLIARLVVGSECLILNPRKYSDVTVVDHNNNPSPAGSPVLMPGSSTIMNSNNMNNASFTTAALANEQLTGPSPVAHTALKDKFTSAPSTANPFHAENTNIGTAALSMVQNSAAAAALAPKLTKDMRTPATTLYSRGERSEYFTLILGGSVRIIAGREQFHHEIHTFAWLGEHALMSSDGSFVPAFDAFAVAPCRILRIHTRAFNAVRSVASLNAMANSVAATAKFSIPHSTTS